ncbi:MAG: thioredoxin-disulfide reductase [Anaerolineae bacterium]|jgi:thioredoxin reductase (NADPH)
MDMKPTFKLAKTPPEGKRGSSKDSGGAEVPFYDLIIIGGGPAGLTAATYAGRAAIKTLVLLGPNPGGQVSYSEHVENFPGFPEGISGTELAQRMQAQAERFGAELSADSATEVDFSSSPLIIRTHSNVYRSRTAIVATGAAPRLLGVPGEKEFFGRGVSTCATCDGFFYKGKEVAVIGGGDSAVDEGIVLTKFADKVTIVHRRDELRATKIYQERAFANPKVYFKWDSVVEEVLGDDTVTGIRLRNVKSGEESVLDVDGVFIYIGMVPRTEIFEAQLELDDWGYVVSDKRMHTSVPGVFVAGDVQDPLYRQIVVATGSGAIAAMEAEKFLGEYPHPDMNEETTREDEETVCS